MGRTARTAEYPATNTPFSAPAQIEFAHGGGFMTIIKFQDGPIKEYGKNGIFIEDLLEVCQ